MTSSFPTFHRDDSSRGLALQVLVECHEGNAFVQEILDTHLARAPQSSADRRLITQLTYGVLRRRGTLDALLRPLVTRPRHKVEAWLWEALRLGAYQLTVLTHLPHHAILHETVELAAVFGRPGAKGFLNGVLRSLSRLVTEERVATPAADALPLEDGQYRRMTQAVFPDPASDFPGYFAAAFSLPTWLAERWCERYSPAECVRLGFWFARPAPLWLRVNPLRSSREQLLQALTQAEIPAEPGQHPQAIRMLETRPVRDLPGFAEGWFTVQDETAMSVASALQVEPGWRVLDLCAAPGGKSTHLAELMHDRGKVLACDTDPRRLRLVSELSSRLGLTCIEPRPLDGPKPAIPDGPFDAVLLDVPCSNTGVLGRRPEVRWRLHPGDFPHLIRKQFDLVHLARERVRSGGVLVYSTCSIESEENAQLMRTILKDLPDLSLEAERLHTPGEPADGGYWARLRRGPTR